MMKILAHDVINDVALIQTSHKNQPNFHIRYGLEIRNCYTIEEALRDFFLCQQHALECEGLIKP